MFDLFFLCIIKLKPCQVRQLFYHGVINNCNGFVYSMGAALLDLENPAKVLLRGNRYLITPEQILKAEREARDEGLYVVGFFHSHPAHPALPSAFDLEHAWPYYTYLIVSVERGRVADARAWRLAPDRSRFEPETLEPPPAEAVP